MFFPSLFFDSPSLENARVCKGVKILYTHWGSWIAKFWGIATRFLSCPEPLAKLWQDLLGHSLSGAFCLVWKAQDSSTLVAVKGLYGIPASQCLCQKIEGESSSGVFRTES